MAGQLSITYADGRVEPIDIKMSDLVHFERRFGMSFSEVEKEPRMDHILFLAWNALRRTGRETSSYDDWLDEVEDFETEADAPVPSLPPPA